jgi:hypothetical protein
MADRRFLKLEHELLDGVSEGTPLTIRKVKGNPNIIVRVGGDEIEMSVDEAKEHISAKGEEWIPRMFRPEPEDFVDYDDEHLRLAHALALKSHERFKRDAEVYDMMPNGNDAYANAHIHAERWLNIATLMEKEIRNRCGG